MKSRTENVKVNLIFNTIKFVTQLVLQFVLRTILIIVLGEEYLGINGLFSNILSFLNLAELGIGSAIVFSMYKPIADGDIEKIKSLQALYKKFYSIIFIVVLSLGLILLPFIKFFIKGEVTVDINIYVLYIMYLINTLIGYFSAHKRSLLFAYQRNDVENKVKTVCFFVMTIFQIVILIAFKNFYLYFMINIIFTAIESIIIHKYSIKLYPEINGIAQRLDKNTKTEISKNVFALSIHKISSVIVFSTDNILISALLGLTILGAYSNYYLIISTLTSVFILLTNALTGSVGNLIASTDKQYAYEKFKLINFLFTIFSSFTTICLVVLFQPFMSLWSDFASGGVTLLGFSSVILLSISFYLNRMRTAVLMFIDGTGLYYKNRFVPVLEAVANLSISILLGLIMGLNGVILGTIISTLIAPFWSGPQVLYKHYFKKSVWLYFKRYIIDTLTAIMVGIITYSVCAFIPDIGIWWLIVKFAVCGLLTLTLLLIAHCRTQEFKECVALAKGFLSKRKNKIKD